MQTNTAGKLGKLALDRLRLADDEGSLNIARRLIDDAVLDGDRASTLLSRIRARMAAVTQQMQRTDPLRARILRLSTDQLMV